MAQDNASENRMQNDRMQEELEDFKREQARVRQVLGRVGGKSQAKIDMAINMAILGIIIALFVLEALTDWIPTLVSLEIGILLVSVKIVWMIHTNSRAYHFQFWVLNSIEFRVNEISKTIRSIEERLETLEYGEADSDGDDAEAETERSRSQASHRKG
jgi:hypothetical protein